MDEIDNRDITLVTIHDRPKKTALGEYHYLIECAGCSYDSYADMIKNSSLEFRYLGSFDVK